MYYCSSYYILFDLQVRPREWLALNGFRVKKIHTEKASMEVKITIQHRDSWQNISQISDSKANLVSYCHEVQKKLGMQYHTPPVPLQLLKGNTLEYLVDSQNNITTSATAADNDNNNKDQAEIKEETVDDFQFQQFRKMATKYNLRASSS